jgi:hypothetical protein
MYRHIAILLVLTAPPHRYPELARILRTLFNAIGRQEKGKYGEETSGMHTLGAIAYALAIFDPKSAPAIKARSSEYGIFWRNVQWGLAGITPTKFADMLAYAGVIDPLRPVELRYALINPGLGPSGYRSWLRESCYIQNRIMEVNYDEIFTRDQTYREMG